MLRKARPTNLDAQAFRQRSRHRATDVPHLTIVRIAPGRRAAAAGNQPVTGCGGRRCNDRQLVPATAAVHQRGRRFSNAHQNVSGLATFRGKTDVAATKAANGQEGIKIGEEII